MDVGSGVRALAVGAVAAGLISGCGTSSAGSSTYAGPAGSCPIGLTSPALPTVDVGSTYCGPEPSPGNGTGVDGSCAGTETTPPCGPGVVPGRMYSFTLFGSCWTTIRFDGQQWLSQLPIPTLASPTVPTAFPDPLPASRTTHVWMFLQETGEPRYVNDDGTVGFSRTDAAFTGCH